MKIRIAACFLLAFCLLRLCGAVPEYYRVLSNKIPEIVIDNPALSPVHSPWRPNAEEQKRGYGMAVLPPAVNPRPDFLWQEREPEQRIRQFLGAGEFRSVWLVIHGVEAQQGVRVTAGALKNAAGGTLLPENFLFQRVFWGGRRTGWDDRNCYLVADAPWNITAGQSLWVWVTLHAPVGSAGGIYRGEFTVESAGGSSKVPVELAVLEGGDFSIQVPWGGFMPGHFNMESTGIYVNYTPEWFNAQRLKHWAGLMKSRGAVSPFPYHIYPEITMKDGKISVETPVIDALLQQMREWNMTGPLLMDMRYFCRWAAAAAEEIVNRKLDVNSATVNVRGENGLDIARRSLRAYPNFDLTREIFRRTMKVVDAKFSKSEIPVLYLSEEEIAYHNINGFHNPKTVAYETFNPVLMEVVGREKVCLVDNGFGYGDGRIDRAHRDNVKYRSYNNWGDGALERTAGSDALIWLYNFGPDRRLAHYMMRTGAQAYHQWADQWGTPEDNENFWTFSALNDDGAVTTVQMERMAMGMRDLTYYLLLDKYADRAEQAGKRELAQGLRTLKQELFGKLSDNRVEFEQASSGMTDADHDRIRWQCVLAVSKVQSAMGEKPLWDAETSAASGSPLLKARVDAVNTKAETGSGSLAQVMEIHTAPVIDGENKDAAWRIPGGLSGFKWTGQVESQMRARAASEEEFKRMPPPSGSFVQMAYDDKALYFLASGNHVGPAASKHADDDPNIWSDDVFEFFFCPAVGEPIYQLIVNSRGARTLLRGGKVMPDNPVKVAVKSPINATGGTAHEIVIPWTVFGRKGKPSVGELWQFNVCRNFNSWHQLSSWAQVRAGFGLADGKMIFGGAARSGELEVNGVPGELGVGLNRLKLTWKATPALKCFVRDEKNRAVQKCAAGLNGVELEVKVPEKAAGKLWKVILLDAKGRKMAQIPVPVGAIPVEVNDSEKLMVRGTPWKVEVTLKIGNQHLADNPLKIELQGADGKKTVQCLMQPGKSRIAVDTDNLMPGKYQAQLKVPGIEYTRTLELEILPGPF